jgi:hypothetical protein
LDDNLINKANHSQVVLTHAYILAT